MHLGRSRATEGRKKEERLGEAAEPMGPGEWLRFCINETHWDWTARVRVRAKT